jgi:hypothetical protein
MRVGITGHQRLSSLADWKWVEETLAMKLSSLPGKLTGFTSLALGADQLFAEIVLKRGGVFTAVVPFADYALKFVEGPERDAYHRLLAQAEAVEVMKTFGSNREAYFKAGKQVVNRSELLIAVWNGKPAMGLGGTADVVKYAQSCGKQITHLDPVNRCVHEVNYV